MKGIIMKLIRLCLVLWLANSVLPDQSAIAQELRTVTIPPDSVGILNAVINGDTIGSNRRDSNTVYILKRNAVYKTTGTILNSGYHLRIRVEDGPGSMPIIQPTPARGGEAERPFTIQGDFSLDGAYVTNVNDIGGFLLRTFRVNVGDVTVRLTNCWIDGAGQAMVRLDAPGARVYIENCVVSHIGQPFNTGNGRVVDVRGGGDVPAADSIVMRNNTFYNIARRLIRFGGNLGARYVEVSNNTIVNSAVQVISLEQSLQARIVDNLFVNPNFEGSLRGAELINIDAFNQEQLYIENNIDPVRTLEIYNNWFHYQDDIINIWADSVTAPDIYQDDIYDTTIDPSGNPVDSVGLNSPPFTFTGPVTFSNAPGPSTAVVVGVIRDALFVDNRDNGVSPNWNFTESLFFQLVNGELEIPWEFPYDFSLDISSPAASAATDGGPLGDRNWQPKQIDVVVGLDEPESLKTVFYPNPAVDQITLASGLKAEVLRITGFDGKSYIVIDNPGRVLDVSTLAAGMYILQLIDKDNKIVTRKIIKN